MVAVLAGIVITGACVGAVAYGVLQGLDEAEESKRELTLFLQRISAGDTTAAYEQFSREAKAEVRPSDFARAPQQREFQDFAKLNTEGWNINLATGQDTTLLYQGTVTYKDGSTGDLEAQLVKQGGVWKIHNVTITR
jgi:hypothetical protein